MSKPTYIDDYALITAALNKYNEGVAQASSAIMKPAFAQVATMFGVENGKLSGGPISGLFDGIDTAFKASPEARAVIARVDIIGTAASARVDTNEASGFCFTDFFHLLKVDGDWTIVSKIYHTHPGA